MEIGRGAQYRVIDRGDGRVEKVPLTRSESEAIIRAWPENDESIQRYLQTDYNDLALKSTRRLGALLAKYPTLLAAFGNPIFGENGRYTQDKVSTLATVMSDSDDDVCRALIRAYVSSLLIHWRYGFSETSYNSTINYGVNPHGEVILMDLGELTYDRSEVHKNIERRIWAHPSSAYHTTMRESLRGYYEDEMKSALTLHNLDTHWQSSL